MMPKPKPKSQLDRFQEAARDAGADMSKEQFGRVLGKMAKAEPEKTPPRTEKADQDRSTR